MLCSLKAATASWESYALDGGVVNKPANSPFTLVVDETARQLLPLFSVEDLFHYIFLAATSCNEGDLETSLGNR
jgi:hypothetical protein